MMMMITGQQKLLSVSFYLMILLARFQEFFSIPLTALSEKFSEMYLLIQEFFSFDFFPV